MYGSASRVKSISETADGTIWVGTVSGLQRMPPASRESGRFERVPEIASTVRALREDRTGDLWIGTIGDGLLRYSEGRLVHVTAPDNPPSAPYWPSSTTTNRISGLGCRPVCCA